MRIENRSDTENLLVCPVELKNQLKKLLEFLNLHRPEVNQNNAQKTMQNLELVQETKKVPKLPKKRPDSVKWV